LVLVNLFLHICQVFKNLNKKMKNLLKTLFVAIVAMSVTFAYAQNGTTPAKSDKKMDKKADKKMDKKEAKPKKAKKAKKAAPAAK
jgi:hypothetical protein